MNSRLFAAFLAAAASSLIFPHSVLTEELDHRKARELVNAGKIAPLRSIAEKAEKIVKGGKLLEVELQEELGIIFYNVEILDPVGVVWEMRLNAESGELIKMSKDVEHQ